jgi:predicted GNAT family N-acyltransferase
MMRDLLALSEVEVSIARSDDERDRCFALRYRVYVEEQGRQPPTADHQRKLDRNADDDTGILFCASIDGEIIGTARVHHSVETGIPPFVSDAFDLPRLMRETPSAHTAFISRLAIDARHRGGKAIVALLRGCFAFLTEEGRDTSLALILAFDQPKLMAMYRLLGFRPIAHDARCMTDLGPTIPMIATLGR